MAETIIKLENICKIYQTGAERVNALTDINLELEKGDFAAVVGASGSGKSTLMNILGLLDRADGGKYLLDGADVSKLRAAEIDRIRSRKLGFIFQKFCLIPTMTALENVMLPLYYAGESLITRREKALRALDTVGLIARVNHRPHELSGGQQQRVAVARAIIAQPKVILADEPTGNLDSESGKTVMKLLKSLNSEGRTVVLITHDMSVAAQAGRIIEISDGRIKPSVVPDGVDLMSYAML